MHAFVKKWGGSLVIRIDPEDSRRLGLREGMEVDVDIQVPPIDLSDLPTFHGGRDDAEHHDELLHGGH